jgi:Rrf2 family protein
MHLTSRTLYGIRTLVELASKPENPYRHGRDLAKKLGIPREYLNQILSQLRDGELINAKKGPHGGYRLARSAEEISLNEVVEILEKPAFLSTCTMPKNSKCEIIEKCPTRDVLEQVAGRLHQFLSEISIAEINNKIQE